MKFSRRTLVLALTAFVLTLAVILTQGRSPDEASQDSAIAPLFTFTEADIQSLRIDMPPDRQLTVERDANGFWQMTEPETALANQGAFGFLANLLVTATGDRALEVPTADANIYGLDQPFATLDITLANQETHKLVLGTFTFNRSGLYALVDPPNPLPDPLSITIVPADFELALNRPMEEWKEPDAEAAPTEDPENAQ